MKFAVFVLTAAVSLVSNKNNVEAYKLEQTPAHNFAQTLMRNPTCTAAPLQVK